MTLQNPGPTIAGDSHDSHYEGLETYSNKYSQFPVLIRCRIELNPTTCSEILWLYCRGCSSKECRALTACCATTLSCVHSRRIGPNDARQSTQDSRLIFLSNCGLSTSLLRFDCLRNLPQICLYTCHISAAQMKRNRWATTTPDLGKR